MHEVVADDHHAHGYVADHAGDEYEHVNGGDRYDYVQRQVLGPAGPQQVVLHRLVRVLVERRQVRSGARRVVHVGFVVVVVKAAAPSTSIYTQHLQNTRHY